MLNDYLTATPHIDKLNTMTMISRIFNVTPEQDARLNALVDWTDLCRSEIVRRAIDEYIEHHPEPNRGHNAKRSVHAHSVRSGRRVSG